MSSYIVSDFHINALVTFGVLRGAQFYVAKSGWEYFNQDTAQVMATLLYRANVCSVNRRYKERTRTTGFKYKKVDVSGMTDADIVKACNCLDYQSCDVDTWERSRARKALQAIREEAIKGLIKRSGVWELQDPALEELAA